MNPLNTTAGPIEEAEPEDNDGPIPQTRSKRNRMKPKWLKDYEVP